MLFFINHKSNLSLEEITDYEKELRDLNVIVFPSLCYLSIFQNGNYKLGSQDISEYESNDKSGEITGKQLNSLNVKYCLIGHRDRRIFKKENTKTLISKTKNCLMNNIIPLYCLNENDIISNYEINELFKIKKNKEIILVYEPYKNIGQNKPDLSQVDNNIKKIKEHILKKYNTNIKIICGGGINLNNIDYIKEFKNIDGIIMSSSTLNINELKKLYNIMNEKI